MLSNSFLIMTLYLHAYHDIGEVRKRMSVFCTAYIIKMALTTVVTIYMIMAAVG